MIFSISVFSARIIINLADFLDFLFSSCSNFKNSSPNPSPSSARRAGLLYNCLFRNSPSRHPKGVEISGGSISSLTRPLPLACEKKKTSLEGRGSLHVVKRLGLLSNDLG